MKKTDVILGVQWGDEGKGKIVDVLTPKYDVVARFQGGPNAGHSLKFEGQNFVLHTVPSGIFRKGAINVIGNGVVIDPVVFSEEVKGIEKMGVDVKATLKISKKAHLILPTHRALDAAQETAKGAGKIGSTLKGIGPAYTDKISRNGLRVGDLLMPDFMDRYHRLRSMHMEILKNYCYEFNVAKYEREWLECVNQLKQYDLIDSEEYVNNLLDQDKSVLAEGAQGTMLDIDFGTYPFVTSSNTSCAGVCTGLGVAPARIGKVMGIFKAYCTRVGSGPFPTELFDAVGDKIREVGREFGSTTGRPRRCGWLDMVAMKYAVMINGITELIMMKADVLSGMETIRVATAYKIDGKEVAYFPYEADEKIEPVYKDFPGWKEDITGARSYSDLPVELRNYIEYIEKECKVKVGIVSVGPDRSETIIR